MADNIRKCDVCGAVFEIYGSRYLSSSRYNPLELPYPVSLKGTIKDTINSKARRRVRTVECDVCADCLIAICEAMLARRKLEDG